MMRVTRRIGVQTAVIIALAAAAFMQPSSALAGDRGKGQKAVMDDDRTPEAERAALPFAQGRTFATLDAYLAFLERRGAMDIPWYRETRPGVYELVGRRTPGAPPKIFTRKQLMERFGFTR